MTNFPPEKNIPFKSDFKESDYWFVSCDESATSGNLDFCLSHIDEQITSDIDVFISEINENLYYSLCNKAILKVRQKCLKDGFASGEDWQIIHESLIETVGGEANA